MKKFNVSVRDLMAFDETYEAETMEEAIEMWKEELFDSLDFDVVEEKEEKTYEFDVDMPVVTWLRTRVSVEASSRKQAIEKIEENEKDLIFEEFKEAEWMAEWEYACDFNVVKAHMRLEDEMEPIKSIYICDRDEEE